MGEAARGQSFIWGGTPLPGSPVEPLLNVMLGCRFTGRLGATYRLDAERFSRSKLTRVLFIRKEQRRSVEASVVEDSLTMNRQTDANSVCHSYVAHIAVSLQR